MRIRLRTASQSKSDAKVEVIFENSPPIWRSVQKKSIFQWETLNLALTQVCALRYLGIKIAGMSIDHALFPPSNYQSYNLFKIQEDVVFRIRMGLVEIVHSVQNVIGYIMGSIVTYFTLFTHISCIFDLLIGPLVRNAKIQHFSQIDTKNIDLFRSRCL